MKKIIVSDVTLNTVSSSLSFKEKIEVARSLSKIAVDVIELGAIENERTDALFVKTVSAFAADNTISLAVSLGENSVEKAWEALSAAKKKRLRVVAPVSPTLMEYSAHKKAPQMLELVRATIAKCASFTKEVEFSAVDATRSEEKFLSDVIAAAVESGATIVSVSEDAGKMLPDEFAAFVKKVRAMLPEGVRLGVSASDGMAVALASLIGALDAGADEVKVAVEREGAPSLAAFAEIMKNRGEDLGYTTSLNKTELGRLTKQIAWIANTKRGEKMIARESEGESVAEFVLGKDESAEAVAKMVKKLGYELSDDDDAKVYEEFLRVAEKKQVGAKELEAIVASVALQVPPTYRLINFTINSSNILPSTSTITLEKNGETLQGVSIGDGPIDASFVAIEQIVGCRYELDDFGIQSVTEGKEAVGSAIVKLRAGGKLYSGNGISTDILGAAIRAYLNAINKIIYEENQA